MKTHWKNRLSWCRWIHRKHPRFYDDDHNTSSSNITLPQKPNCTKSSAVQKVWIVTTSAGITYELWYENTIRGCWKYVATDKRKMTIRNEKSLCLSYSLVNSFPFSSMSKRRSRYENDFIVSTLSFILHLKFLRVDSIYQIPEIGIV